MKKYLYVLLAAIILIALFVGIGLKSKPWQNLTVSSPASTSRSKADDQNTVVARENIDIFLQPDEKGKKVGYWVPGQKFILTKDKTNGFIMVEDLKRKDWRLWIREGSPYKPTD